MKKKTTIITTETREVWVIRQSSGETREQPIETESTTAVLAGENEAFESTEQNFKVLEQEGDCHHE